jgi:beta-lactamase regulating signal transducer with metallopeptidase domain/DUF4097 and DUF4098 domain-containing protein YvlB
MIAFIIKLTTLLAAGLGCAALLRSRSAALRHLVLIATLGSTIALAVATVVMPPLAVPVPAFAASRSASPATDTHAAAVRDAATELTPVAVRERSIGGDAVSARPAPTLASALIAMWLAGASVVLAWWLLGHAGLARLASRASPVTGAAWGDLLAELIGPGGIHRDVELRHSADVGSPVVWGVHRPVILLPSVAERWSAERRRAVLAHELAHVARRDGLMNVVTCAAAALYWFHPLVWLAMHRLRLESEHACDDRVLARGTSGAEYAAHLLEVARGARALRLAGLSAIGMARPTHLEGRLLAVLDETRARAEPDSVTRIVLCAALALAVPVLAGARAVPLASSDETVRVAATTERSDPAIERTLDATPGETLTLDLETGARVDLRGWDEPRVRVRARLGGRDRDATRVDIERVADGVRVHMWVESSGQIYSSSHALEISVPRRYDLRLKSSGGGLSLTDLEGNFSGNTGGGSLTIERVSGEARLATGGGDIRVKDVHLDGSVTTGGGRVELSNVSGNLRGSSGSGPVIHRDAGVDDGSGKVSSGRLHISQAGGDVRLPEITDGADIETGGGDIHVARARGDVTASTGGGDIEIAHVAGGVRAGTGAGTIHISVDELDRDGRGVTIHSGNGTVVLELPADVAATFDVETAYTDNYRRKTRIDSDWQLEQSESDAWDDRQGTPRKYVRARGDAGGGGPLIKVRTVNGDVLIHRTDTRL